MPVTVRMSGEAETLATIIDVPSDGNWSLRIRRLTL